jgi:membrane protein DedA with SNARE-associated domain
MISRIIELLSAFVIYVISAGGYAGIVLLTAIGSACIPLPSEVVMAFSGYLVASGRFSLLWVTLAGALGNNVGSAIAYAIGYYGGRPLVERYGSYVLLSRRELDWADRFFARHGDTAVFVGRLLPLVRAYIALPAGIARMPQLRFHVYTFLGSLPWCLGLAYFGMVAGENWKDISKYFHRFDAVIGAVLVIGIAWFVWSHWKHRMRAA